MYIMLNTLNLYNAICQLYPNNYTLEWKLEQMSGWVGGTSQTVRCLKMRYGSGLIIDDRSSG